MVLCFCMHGWLQSEMTSAYQVQAILFLLVSPSRNQNELQELLQVHEWVRVEEGKTEYMEVDRVNEEGKERRDNYICHFSHRFPMCSWAFALKYLS